MGTFYTIYSSSLHWISKGYSLFTDRISEPLLALTMALRACPSWPLTIPVTRPNFQCMGVWSLVRKCFSKYSRMGTVRMKIKKQTKEERREYRKRQSSDEEKGSRLPITTKSKCNNNKHNIYYSVKYGKLQWNSLTKNEIDNNRKIIHPPP